MGIKSEMLKYAAVATAAAAQQSRTFPNVFLSFHCFRFIFGCVQRQQMIACLERFLAEKDRGKHNFLKSCDGITTENKSKAQNENGKKQQTTNNEVHTSTEMPATV